MAVGIPIGELVERANSRGMSARFLTAAPSSLPVFLIGDGPHGEARTTGQRSLPCEVTLKSGQAGDDRAHQLAAGVEGEAQWSCNGLLTTVRGSQDEAAKSSSPVRYAPILRNRFMEVRALAVS